MKLAERVARRHAWLGLGPLSGPLTMQDFERGDVAKSVFAMDVCWTCGRQDAKKLCGHCRVLRYCDTECQHRDWAEHKAQCGTYRAANQEGLLFGPQSFLLGMFEW